MEIFISITYVHLIEFIGKHGIVLKRNRLKAFRAENFLLDFSE
jgi:hypothetical protein